MFNSTEELDTRPFMVMQKKCIWNETLLFGNFKLKFSWHSYIRPLPATYRKASYVLYWGIYFAYKLMKVGLHLKRNQPESYLINRQI